MTRAAVRTIAEKKWKARLIGARGGVSLIQLKKGAGQEKWAGREVVPISEATMKREPIGTVLVGPSALLREGLGRILSAAGFRILASVSSVDDPVLNSLPQEQPILLIIDVSDDFDRALELIESFKQRYPAGRVAVLDHQQHLTQMLSAFRTGANAYLVKVATCDAFIKSLELVMLGVTLLPPEVLTFISDRHDRNHNGHAAGYNGHPVDEDDADNGYADDDDGGDDREMVGTEFGANEHEQHAVASYTPRLSARQQSILGCLIQGDSNKTIARKMAITEATVKVHVKAILRKIRVHNRTQAAIWAMSTGPFTSAKDEASPALDGPPVEPFANLDVAQVLSAAHEDRSTLSPTPKVEKANHIGLPNIVRLVRKGIRRNND
jgi:two-component system, NarL family, nitrate/nitrite response regulator NarL